MDTLAIAIRQAGRCAALLAATTLVTVSFAGDNDYTAGSRTTTDLTVTAAANDVTLTPIVVSGLMGAQVTLSIQMASGGTALLDEPVAFAVDGNAVGAATSDAAGVSLAYTIPTNMSAGAHSVTVMFAGDADYNPSCASSAVLTVSYPDAPSYCAAYATSSTSIRVYWETVEGATEYRIYRASTSGGYNFTSPAAVVPVVTGDEHFYDDHRPDDRPGLLLRGQGGRQRCREPGVGGRQPLPQHERDPVEPGADADHGSRKRHAELRRASELR